MGHSEVRFSPRQLLSGLIHGIGLAGMMVGLSAVQHIFLSIKPQATTQALLATHNISEVIFLIGLVILLLPIGEEVICRGYIYPRLAEVLGTYPAMAATSLIYSALHFDIARLPALFFAGLWLNILYRKSGLITSILAHIVWNGLGVVLIKLTI